MKQWYEELFENYANSYENEPFVKGTKGEVDFIEREINYNKDFSILDIGCGTGRHCSELAKRGYRTTGIDLSAAQLKKARCNTLNEKIRPDFIRTDARYFSFKNKFDLALMICEGAFPLMETDEMNFNILKNVSLVLKPGGIFIFTTLNGLFPLVHSVNDFINGQREGNAYTKNSFDLMTFREFSDFEFTDDSGTKRTLQCNERYYVPSEITWMLNSLNFSKVEIFGAESGNWKRDKELTPEDFEMLVISKL